MTNIINNSIKEDRGYRYDSIVRQFASALYILGGRTAYEFVRINVSAFLPSIQSIQSSTASSENYLTEGHFDFNRVGDYFNSKKTTLAFCAEDCTATVSKIVYDTQTDTFIGFPLPLDQNGLPIAKLYSTDSFTCLENWYLNDPIAKSLGAHLIQPLSSSLENTSPYLLAVYGTNNKFKSPDVIARWGYIYRQCKAKGVRVIGYSSDCDSRY
ncbi:unnamed protein product [Rotaria magnacalcarata]|uniref:Uncharacterized protein n=1 Tax=Rotaria magnacalcarata TaxID=392030 RepID=A0A820MZX3_9BILA|nr:unnamed protein product [Rotaria magnacalcarata]